MTILFSKHKFERSSFSNVKICSFSLSYIINNILIFQAKTPINSLSHFSFSNMRTSRLCDIKINIFEVLDKNKARDQTIKKTRKTNQ